MRFQPAPSTSSILRTWFTSWLLGASAVLPLSIPFTTPAAAQERPKVLIDINQIRADEVPGTTKLKCDGMFFLALNSPSITYNQLNQIRRNIGGYLISEDGAISPTHLLNGVMTPRLAFSTPDGRQVLASGTAPLTAGTPPQNSAEIDKVSWFRTPANGNVAPRTPPALTELVVSGTEMAMRTNSGHWVQATNGGGSTLAGASNDTGPNSAPWERFRLHKLTAGDGLIRYGDFAALQTWNGFFDGGNIVGVQLSGSLIADRPDFTSPTVPLRVIYSCEFAAASQLAGVDYCLAYFEFSDAVPGARQYTLPSPMIDQIHFRTGKRVLVLGRTFVDISPAPGVLPTLRQQVIDALNNPHCAGVVFERFAGTELESEQLLEGIAAVCSRQKLCFMLLPPNLNANKSYVHQIRTSVENLKKSPWYSQLHIVLACYPRKETDVTFLGGKHSVEGALKWIKLNGAKSGRTSR